MVIYISQVPLDFKRDRIYGVVMDNFLTYEQLNQLEYLFEQSSVGNHLLFDKDQIKEVFTEEHHDATRVVNLRKMDLIRKRMEKLILLPTLSQKKAFVENLPSNAKTMLIRAYFNMLDHTLKTQKTSLH